jgi:hypothetical protein
VLCVALDLPLFWLLPPHAALTPTKVSAAQVMTTCRTRPLYLCCLSFMPATSANVAQPPSCRKRWRARGLLLDDEVVIQTPE